MKYINSMYRFVPIKDGNNVKQMLCIGTSNEYENLEQVRSDNGQLMLPLIDKQVFLKSSTDEGIRLFIDYENPNFGYGYIVGTNDAIIFESVYPQVHEIFISIGNRNNYELFQKYTEGYLSDEINKHRNFVK